MVWYIDHIEKTSLEKKPYLFRATMPAEKALVKTMTANTLVSNMVFISSIELPCTGFVPKQERLRYLKIADQLFLINQDICYHIHSV